MTENNVKHENLKEFVSEIVETIYSSNNEAIVKDLEAASGKGKEIVGIIENWKIKAENVEKNMKEQEGLIEFLNEELEKAEEGSHDNLLSLIVAKTTVNSLEEVIDFLLKDIKEKEQENEELRKKIQENSTLSKFKTLISKIKTKFQQLIEKKKEKIEELKMIAKIEVKIK